MTFVTLRINHDLHASTRGVTTITDTRWQVFRISSWVWWPKWKVTLSQPVQEKLQATARDSGMWNQEISPTSSSELMRSSMTRRSH